MKYAVDRIIEQIAVLENIETEDIVEVRLSELPKDVREGSVVISDGDVYALDLNEENDRRESIRERLERLKKLKK